MNLGDLENGSNVYIEVVWEDGSFQLPTQIVTSMRNELHLLPIEYKGSVVDLNKNKLKGRSFNLYGFDSKTGNRYVWKSVTIELRQNPPHRYYLVNASKYGMDGRLSDRRDDARLPVNKSGIITFLNTGRHLNAEIYDISNGGVAFCYSTQLDVVGDTIIVELSDAAKGQDFRVSAKCRVVREMKKEDKFLYGCRFMQTDKTLMNYVCLKKIEIAQEMQRKKMQGQKEST